jgi:PEP-CTERM motif
MSEYQFTITGQAGYGPTDQLVGPFTVTFDVDASAGTQSFYYFSGYLGEYLVTGTAITNLTETLNGQTLISNASYAAIIGGSGNAGGLDTGLDSTIFLPGFNSIPPLYLEYVAVLPQTEGHYTLDSIFAQSQFQPMEGYFADLYIMDGFTIQAAVVPPVTSVPEPSSVALLATGLVVVLWRAKFFRRFRIR